VTSKLIGQLRTISCPPKTLTCLLPKLFEESVTISEATLFGSTDSSTGPVAWWGAVQCGTTTYTPAVHTSSSCPETGTAVGAVWAVESAHGTWSDIAAGDRPSTPQGALQEGFVESYRRSWSHQVLVLTTVAPWRRLIVLVATVSGVWACHSRPRLSLLNSHTIRKRVV